MSDGGYIVYVALFVIWTVLVAAVAMWWGKRHPSAAATVAADVEKVKKAIGQ
jgi:hypothetical protein